MTKAVNAPKKALDFLELGALKRRRELLLERVRTLVAEKGEAAVFY